MTLTSRWNATAIGATIFLTALIIQTGCVSHNFASGGPMTIEQNKAIARRWTEELWGQGNLSVADEIIAPEYVRHDPGDPFPARGPEDVKRIVTMLRTMLPDLKLEIEA